MSFFKKKKKDDGIVVLKKPEPKTGGGTNATLDTKAPHVIRSEEMTLFDVSCALNGNAVTASGDRLGFISAYAVRAATGSFLFLSTGERFRRTSDKNASWALAEANVFPALVSLVRECDLAKNNGFRSHTSGLPENFGGEIDVRYESGERISVSNNQSPIITSEVGLRIARFFKEAMEGERVPLPSPDDIVGVRFSEERKNGGFTRAVLTLRSDGSGSVARTARYDDERVYESSREITAEAVAGIRRTVAEKALFARAFLPETESFLGDKKELVFVLRDGGEVRVPGDVMIPDELRGGFFDVELTLTSFS